MTDENPICAGTAYGFFDCAAPKEAIEEFLPEVREYYAQTPSELELSLHEGTAGLDETLTRQLGDFRIFADRGQRSPEITPLADLRYVLVARYPGHSNEKAAGELGDVLNYVSRLNKDESMFRAAIVYETDGQYMLRE